MPDDLLASLSVDQRTTQWEAILADEQTTVLVAGDVDGFVAFVPEVREIRALYVDPRTFRKGIGSALLTAAHNLLDGDAALWVLDGNERAFAFYRRHGYEADGARSLHEGSGVEQVRMTRRPSE